MTIKVKRKIPRSSELTPMKRHRAAVSWKMSVTLSQELHFAPAADTAVITTGLCGKTASHDEDAFEQGPGCSSPCCLRPPAFGPGTKLSCEVQDDSILLTPQVPKMRKHTAVVDEVTGLIVTKRISSKPSVTSEMVKSLLADFP